MTELVDARTRAQRLYPRSTQFQNTFVAGARAAILGRPADACPYQRDGAGSWRRTFRSVWLHGWESVERDEVE